VKYKREGEWERTVARLDGIYTLNGKNLVSNSFTQEEVDEYNKGLVKPGTVHQWTKFLDTPSKYRKVINNVKTFLKKTGK
jgi:hypothetical protein